MYSVKPESLSYVQGVSHAPAADMQEDRFWGNLSDNETNSLSHQEIPAFRNPLENSPGVIIEPTPPVTWNPISAKTYGLQVPLQDNTGLGTLIADSTIFLPDSITHVSLKNPSVNSGLLHQSPNTSSWITPVTAGPEVIRQTPVINNSVPISPAAPVWEYETGSYHSFSSEATAIPEWEHPSENSLQYHQGYNRVRFLHAAVNQHPVIICLNGVTINEGDHMCCADLTPGYTVSSGNLSITLTDTYGSVLNRSQFSLRPNTAYTFAIVNDKNCLSLFAIIDSPCVSHPAKGYIRAVNLSEDMGPSDIIISGSGRVFQSLAYKHISAHRLISQGTYRTSVTPYMDCNGIRLPILVSSVLNVSPGVMHTLFLIGTCGQKPALRIVAAKSQF